MFAEFRLNLTFHHRNNGLCPASRGPEVSKLPESLSRVLLSRFLCQEFNVRFGRRT